MSAFADVELLHDFLTEAGEMLEDVDSKLVELEHRPGDKALLNDIFRGFHTIKGGAGFLDAQPTVQLCHRTESLFDKLRSGEMALTPELLDVILAATGEVHRMFREMGAQAMPEPAPAALLNVLDLMLKGEAVPAALTVVSADAPALAVDVSEILDGHGELNWPLMYQALTGEMLPVADAPAPEPAETSGMEVAQLQQGVTAALDAMRSGPRGEKAPATSAAKENTIRVDTTRFDQILNLSGEIGLTKNRLNVLRTALVRSDSQDQTHKTLDMVLAQLDMLVTDLQSAVMKARMQPVGRVFQKYSRLARDMARQLGKEIELNIIGAETEVDKTILEELNDPLVHMVRNACDHAIETPAERRAAGKSSHGTITLSARQAGDHIVIEIIDDGRGMNAEKLRQKAIEKGLISSDEASNLDPKQCLQLIFLPGFSTKSEITDFSGRGVGMDVVRTNIQKLKGRIDINTVQGSGSQVAIFLPLTLAILPVLMLRVSDQAFAVPLSAVREIVQLREDELGYVSNQPMVMVRGEPVPLLDLAALLNRPQSGQANVGVVVNTAEKNFVLAVDGFLGQDEVMIKPLEGMKPKGVSGATLSGDGQLVLVLELHEVLADYV
ncbi:MAG: chemotaxis protein CheA [Burkholderiaceae bacterium]|nr:MAG: chemotaxis protein CheA [Burkholderiaceae bacterium]